MPSAVPLALLNGTVTVSADEVAEKEALEGSYGAKETFINWPMFYSFFFLVGMSSWVFGSGLIMLNGLFMMALRG